MSQFPTPHLEKLIATLQNEKLPQSDKPRIEGAIKRYKKWINDIEQCYAIKDQSEIVSKMVYLLNEYRFFLDVELIFDSANDFLYRQKGQLKLDNSVLEEFIPRLIHPSILPEFADLEINIGPTTTFSALHFTTEALNGGQVPDMGIRTKDQDFSISRKVFLSASHDPNFKRSITKETYLAYIAAEIKTNLDKTMFQEACATAHDVKSAVSGSKYLLICEWLDMTPVSTAPTDIDEVLIMRKAKRLSSNIRKEFDLSEKRRAKRDGYVAYLQTNRFKVEMFTHFLVHVLKLVKNDAPIEKDVLELGYF